MTNAIKVALGDGFLESFAAIPRGKQKKVMEFVSKFRQNPRASGINYESINDAREPNFRSVRIDQDYRGIVLKPESGNVYVLLWVDKHDDAYDWARRYRCNINPQTGVLQLFEVASSFAIGTADESLATPVNKSEPPKTLFALDDAVLLSLGVPHEMLDAVKCLRTDADLESLEKQLPLEAFEALYLLAAGTDLQQLLDDYALTQAAGKVDIDDYAAALARPASLRRFHVVEDELELIQMLNAPLERWRVFLHPSQRQLVERDWNGPVRVLGGAGTGKTVVAIHRARWLAQHVLQKGEKLLFTTFTSNLATDIEENLKKICTQEQLQRIEVCNLDAWVSQFVKRHKYASTIVYPGGKDGKYDNCWTYAVTQIPASLGLPESFYREEWERIVLPQGIKDRQSYLLASRAGRGVALNRKQRAEIWPAFEEMRLRFAAENLATAEDAMQEAIGLLERGAESRQYRCVVVDEGQDFGPDAMRLIRHLVAESQKNDIFIVGDGHQRIYQRKTNLGQCGINIKGRGKKLRINYRTTEEIRRFATALLENIEIDDLDGGLDSTRDYRSLVHGEKPDIFRADSLQAESAWIIEQIRQLVGEGFALQDICLVARTNPLLKAYEKALLEAGFAICKLSRQKADDRGKPGVRLSTMHRIKGLEFKCVFIAGVNDGTVPLRISMNSTEDPVEQRLLDLNERALFHVAATRAIKHLLISCHGAPSSFIT
jgi:superfamily I DNA/RNA helicase